MWRIVVPVVLVALLLFIWSRQRAPGARTERDLEQEAATESIEEATGARRATPAIRPEPEPVAVLRGRVYGPRGLPVDGAQVTVIRPKPLRLTLTNAQGEYELPLYERGPHLIAARLHIDLGPARQRIEVPGTGDPPRLDFQLEPAGSVFGEIVANGAPVDGAYVDLYVEGERILDTETDNGFFVFTDELPRGKPIHVKVISTEGFPKHPVDFTWQGPPVNLGSIELRPYPTANVSFRLPGGNVVDPVEAYLDSRLKPGTVLYSWANLRSLQLREQLPAFPGVLQLREEEPRVAEVILRHAGEDVILVRRSIRFAYGGTDPQVIEVRPGPVPYTTRLLDERGEALRLTVCRDYRSPAKADEKGRISLDLPTSGVHLLPILGIHLPVHGGWHSIAGGGGFASLLVVDADEPAESLRVDLSRRVLVLGTYPFHSVFRREIRRNMEFRPPGKDFWSVSGGELARAGKQVAYLSPRLEEGIWHWDRGKPETTFSGRKVFRHDYQTYRDWPLLRLRKKGLTILDVR